PTRRIIFNHPWMFRLFYPEVLGNYDPIISTLGWTLKPNKEKAWMYSQQLRVMFQESKYNITDTVKQYTSPTLMATPPYMPTYKVLGQKYKNTSKRKHTNGSLMKLNFSLNQENSL